MNDRSRLKRENEQLEERLEIYELIFENILHGAMVTDALGYITHFNKPYGIFLGLDPAKQIGRHCLDAIENSRMHIVAKTGIAEINHSHRIKGQNMVVQRIPIVKNGAVIAVFGQVMFKNVQDVSKLARKLSELESKVAHYEKELASLRSTRYTFDSIIGENPSIASLKQEALKATANQLPVLITGESGTGKELFAQAIHQASARKIYPFVRINCAAIPKDLLESELFGYERGAFTGAHSSGKPGKIELSDQGTLFLDEIGDLPLDMQPKLLRVLEEREFERVGGTTVLKTNFRLIAATNQNLEQLIEEKRFRKDLYYRLNVIPLHIPPLRERKEDIPALARHFLKEMAREMAVSEIRLDDQTQTILRNAQWPGNVRELSNVLERAVAAGDGNPITRANLPLYLQRQVKADGLATAGIHEIKATAEKEAVISALAATNNNKVRAAKLLGIHRTLLYKKLRKYRIQA